MQTALGVLSRRVSAAVSPIARSLLRALRFVGKLGFGRQGGLAATRRMFPTRAVTPARRTVAMIVGSLMIGTGVALLTQARLGLAPYDVLVSGLQPRLGLSFGQTVWVISAVLFLIATLLGARPNRWGIAFVVSIGFLVDAVAGSVNSPESIVGRYAFVVAAVFAIAAGVSLVVHSGNTGGSFELLMRAGEMRGYNRRNVRTALEVGVLVLGIVLGGSFGPATILIAMSIGPILGLTATALDDHARGRHARLLADSPEARHPSAMAGSGRRA